MLEKVWDPEAASVVLLGEPNAGKTPLARSLGMAVGR